MFFVENMSTIETLISLLGDPKDVQDLMKQAIDVLLTMGDDVKRIAQPIQDFMINEAIRGIRQYQDAGFTKDEAILLYINSKVTLQEALKNLKNKSSP